MSARFRFLLLAASATLVSATAFAQTPASSAPVSAGSVAPDSSTPAPSSATGMTAPADAAQKMIAEAVEKMNANNSEGALNDLSHAITVNPNSTGAYVLRASIYCQKKLWNEAQADFEAAARIAPTNSVLKFNLVEIKFMQKQYDLARPGFLALVNDPDMGDFASYKVFLCDLFAGHKDEAKKELDVFNAAMGNPSYYFSNAAWDLVISKDLDDARSWLLSASRIYPPRKNEYYAQSLRDLGYLPIPAPGDTVTPPAPTGAAAAAPQ